MWQSKIISYNNIYENIARYLLKFITTLYQIKNFSYCLFFLYLIFFTEMFEQNLLCWIIWWRFLRLENFGYDSYSESIQQIGFSRVSAFNQWV